MATKQIFIEQWSCKPTWLALPREKKEAFAAGIAAAMGGLSEMGVRPLGWGFAAPSIDERSSYGFWAVWEMETTAGLAAFMQGVRQSGWYDFFQQENTGGEAKSPAEVMSQLIEVI
jgi:hypothetical protein